MRVAFLFKDLSLSGGAGIVVEHAAQLRRHHGFDTQIVITTPTEIPNWGYRGLRDVPVIGLEEALTGEPWDVAVATWWETTNALFKLDAKRHAYFIQLLEDSTYAPGDPEALAAASTTGLPVTFITASAWIRDIVEQFQPGTRAQYVRSGMAKETFAGPERVAFAPASEPLKIVIEGSAEYVHKGVQDALDAVAMMTEPSHTVWVSPHDTPAPPNVDEVRCGLSHPQMAALYADRHVILKLSRAEGMYGPPLEAFHMGATVVTNPVPGHDEYVEHGVNGLVVGWDDLHGTARALDLLARDRRLLHELRCGALATARAWPAWEQASSTMAVALRNVVREPPPPARGSGLRAISDVVTALSEAQRLGKHIEIEKAVLEEFKSQEAWQWALKLRRLSEKARRPQRKVRGLLRRGR